MNIKIFAYADEASPMIDKQISAMQRNDLNGLEIRNVDDVNISDISIKIGHYYASFLSKILSHLK